MIIVTTTEVEAEVREHLLHSKRYGARLRMPRCTCTACDCAVVECRRRIVLDVVAFECGLGSADVLRRLAPRIKVPCDVRSF